MKLVDLKIKELREELDERGLSIKGNKSELLERLRDVIATEGNDPEEYEFTTMEDQLSKIVAEKLKENALSMEQKLAEYSKKIEENDTLVKNNISTIEEKIISLESELEKLKTNNFTVPTTVTCSKVSTPTFDGQMSWTIYKKQFEVAANSNGWDDKAKAAGLILALRGPALAILQTIPPSMQEDYYTIINALELRFGDQHLTEVYFTQLKARVQKSGESLQEFEAEIERLVRLAYGNIPEDIFNKISRQSFID